ncbi:MAG: MBL fold metallo-hydrolase [Planctomycetaceae bacterium]
MKDRTLQVSTVTSQLFAENAYIAHLEGETECVVFDPGADAHRILQVIDKLGLTVAAILNTHGHADHIAGNASIKHRFPKAPLIIGDGDAEKLEDAELNLSAPFGMPIQSPPADQTVKHGDQIQFAGIPLEIRETPGHSVGHVVFIYHHETTSIVFGGDVLFEGSVGRTDFPDGSSQQLLKSIREQLFTLPDNTIVLPGHGDPTTIGQEKLTNPFVGRSGY